ncbi:RAP domain-containing protein [Endozoicomonas sp. GU-1]|uniref:RAP domain-containing protein n=1 Tax=Endozoicomonas sp. GU-1 TaxID=3009078 RepID=UPI0022B46361|nr:RAP domain-containing protein [Endozoicomonas sp. GU-1]WBA79298.1 DUF1601 domain-containing protein [Endozoicomonas sp. GU-1]WBA86942.1 DUF1601 domain-containing protein [Endozoicomonas sp. GU-1]
MHRSSAGIGGQYAGSGNSYNQPDDHTAYSGRGRYRHATVRQWNNPPRTNPGRDKFYRSSAVRSSQHLQCRLVNPAQDFKPLVKQETMDGLVSKSDRLGHRYDGRHHGQYASSIKKYTSAAKRPLNRAEQSQLINVLQNFTATRSWNWLSLTTTLHSFTSAGVFTLHKPMDQLVQLTQAALLSTLLDALIFKCTQKPEASDIDAQGIANLMWAMAKLVSNGQEWTSGLKEALAALLPHVNAQKDQFNPQHIVNLLWAMAKLMNHGQERTAELKEAVPALFPHVNALKYQFNAQGIANLLWAMAKLVDNGLELTPSLKETVVALLPHVITQKAHCKPQEITNLLWAMAKLVDHGHERTPEFNEALAALLPHINAQKADFNSQEIANLLWAMAKLVDLDQQQTPDINKAVSALLPHVNVQKANFKSKETANLLWAMAKLVDNGQKRTPELKKAVAALLPSVNPQKAYKPRDIANMLWAMAKLVDNGQEQTAQLKAAIATLLHGVNAQKANFKPKGIANMLWAMAKLVDNGLDPTPGLKEAVTALLPHVNTYKDQFNAQAIANLFWAMAKLVDNGQGQLPGLHKAVVGMLPLMNAQKANFKPQEIANLLWGMVKLVNKGVVLTAELKGTVAALLPHMNTQKNKFNAQEIANLFWAMAKLVDNGQEQTSGLKEAVNALLSNVNAQKANFKPMDIACLLWAIAKLGELIEVNAVTSMFESLVYRTHENPLLSTQDILMSIWGVMVCCARLSLVANANKNNVLEMHMDDLFTRLENACPDNEEDQHIIAMAASWLGRPCPVVPHYQTTRSKLQSDFRDQLQSCFPSLKIEEEKSLNSLPPVDLLLPDLNIVIEIQGPFHYVRRDFKTRNGSTLLKIALLQKAGFEVIEIPVNQLCSRDLIKRCIHRIKTRVNTPSQGHGSESFTRPGTDEAYFAADAGWQDHRYLTVEEHRAEQPGKPKSRTRKRKKKPVISPLPL